MSLGYHAPGPAALWDDGSESACRREMRERSAAHYAREEALRDARWANAVAILVRSGDGHCPLLAQAGWAPPGWLPAGGMDSETKHAWWNAYKAIERDAARDAAKRAPAPAPAYTPAPAPANNPFAALAALRGN